MRPTIVLILGFPGTGKLTVSKELISALVAEDAPVRLVDNHSTANVLFNLIAEADGKTPLPREVLVNVREINQIVSRTIEHLSPPDWSFVFTHHLRDNEQNRRYVEQLQTVAINRHSTFLPVVLTCRHDVLLSRVAEPGRRSRNKLVDPTIAETIIEGGMLVPDRTLSIDVTSLPAAEAAKVIQDELKVRSS